VIKSRRVGVSGECGMYRTEETGTQDLEGKQRQIPFGGLRHRWKGIKMDLK
jgi:hypothetical protein